MPLSLTLLLNTCRILFVLHWTWSARRVKSAARTEASSSRLLKYGLPLALACVLMEPTPWVRSSVLAARFVAEWQGIARFGLLPTFLGTALALASGVACWGRRWSRCHSGASCGWRNAGWASSSAPPTQTTCGG